MYLQFSSECDGINIRYKDWTLLRYKYPPYGPTMAPLYGHLE